MKKITLYISIFLIVAGIIARVYADQYSHVTAEGMLVESAWLPIGTLMAVIGVLAIIVLGFVYIIGFLMKSLKKQDKEKT